MITMNRISAKYSDNHSLANLEQLGMGSHFVHASLDKHRRGNCVLDTGYSLKL